MPHLDNYDDFWGEGNRPAELTQLANEARKRLGMDPEPVPPSREVWAAMSTAQRMDLLDLHSEAWVESVEAVRRMDGKG